MDNITHSLLGLAAGEALAVTRKKNRAPLWIASMLANNIPDIDVPIGNILTHDPLSRLLWHRGYSHTLLLAPFQGLFDLAGQNRSASYVMMRAIRSLCYGTQKIFA